MGFNTLCVNNMIKWYNINRPFVEDISSSLILFRREKVFNSFGKKRDDINTCRSVYLSVVNESFFLNSFFSFFFLYMCRICIFHARLSAFLLVSFFLVRNLSQKRYKCWHCNLWPQRVNCFILIYVSAHGFCIQALKIDFFYN